MGSVDTAISVTILTFFPLEAWNKPEKKFLVPFLPKGIANMEAFVNCDMTRTI
jgi:hypothetical protein